MSIETVAFELIIDTHGAAFADDGDYGKAECARILRHVADRLDAGTSAAPVRDANGNTCGHFRITYV